MAGWYTLTLALLSVLIPSYAIPPRPLNSRWSTTSRIVGGQEAAKGQLPYQVSFQEKILGVWFHFCGGVVIAPNFVMTAAHCVEGGDFTSPRGLRVVTGGLDLEASEASEQVADINFIIEHPFYNQITFENDVALLRLETPLIWTEYVDQISLPQPQQNFTGEICRVSGWGRMTEGGASSSTLLYVDLPVLSDEECAKSYVNDELFPSMLCAGGTAAQVGSCQGDSGGPLACGSTLAGLVSWSYGCARPEYPGVYTEVSYFVDWINSHTKRL
ncbi:trypsin-1-like isoform X3 [Eriocheir sinensis]|uniref:trypsin-1-like isoform X1 n=1 Tax=Eriocheir sinensis TaxID=95602 RepID=UPI0021C61486|nr:trypsin-1-like isoform X1 [Eriocheir sinensis]XP_050717481.1 trypsin-1-like isoform X2 [Eriocheir sinensis]XP_050717482.1 trypsin-1-like isoform X3 [Eriocheir sinensis]